MGQVYPPVSKDIEFPEDTADGDLCGRIYFFFLLVLPWCGIYFTAFPDPYRITSVLSSGR